MCCKFLSKFRHINLASDWILRSLFNIQRKPCAVLLYLNYFEHRCWLYLIVGCQCWRCYFHRKMSLIHCYARTMTLSRLSSCKHTNAPIKCWNSSQSKYRLAKHSVISCCERNLHNSKKNKIISYCDGWCMLHAKTKTGRTNQKMVTQARER